MKFVDSIFSLVLYIYKKIDGRFPFQIKILIGQWNERYCIENLETGKKYIGQTTRELIEKREVVYYTETGYVDHPERRELVKRRTSALPLGTAAHAGDVGCL
jgi:hypothetical protein